MRVAINGFGRIGRIVYRLLVDRDDMQVIAINNPYDGKSGAHLLKYDSVHGRLKHDPHFDGEYMVVGKQRSLITQQLEPEKLPWKELKIDLVLECTGAFLSREKAQTHLKAGAKKVLLSAPAKGSDIPTYVYGVNHQNYNAAKDDIVSNASCTTNCLAPVVRVLIDHFGFENAMFCTVHSYTNDQRLLDFSHKDMRRARAAGLSMIPTSTGAAKTTSKVIPETEGKIQGLAVRVPTPNVSLVDLNFRTQKKTTVEEVNKVLKAASQSDRYKGIIDYTDEELVSYDFNGTRVSAFVDGACTMMSGDRDIKVISWYDNETGFSARMLDMVQYMLSR